MTTPPNRPTAHSPNASLSRWTLLIALLLASVLMCSVTTPTAWADDHDEDRRERQRDRDHDEDREDEDEDEWEDEEEDFDWFMVEVELYAQLLDLVLTFEDIASDASTAAVAAIMSVEEHTEDPADAAALFEEVLPQVDNPTVIRAIRLKLVDVYAELDQPEKSIDQIKRLIVDSSEQD